MFYQRRKALLRKCWTMLICVTASKLQHWTIGIIYYEQHLTPADNYKHVDTALSINNRLFPIIAAKANRLREWLSPTIKRSSIWKRGEGWRWRPCKKTLFISMRLMITELMWSTEIIRLGGQDNEPCRLVLSKLVSFRLGVNGDTGISLIFLWKWID